MTTTPKDEPFSPARKAEILAEVDRIEEQYRPRPGRLVITITVHADPALESAESVAASVLSDGYRSSYEACLEAAAWAAD